MERPDLDHHDHVAAQGRGDCGDPCRRVAHVGDHIGVRLKELGVGVDIGPDMADRLLLTLHEDPEIDREVTLEDAKRAGVDDHPALVVRCPPSVEAPVLDLRSPRVGVPARLDRCRLHVVVGVEKDRRRPFRTGHVAVDGGLPLAEIQLMYLCAVLLQELHRRPAHVVNWFLRKSGEGARGVAHQVLEILGEVGHEGFRPGSDFFGGQHHRLLSRGFPSGKCGGSSRPRTPGHLISTRSSLWSAAVETLRSR